MSLHLCTVYIVHTLYIVHTIYIYTFHRIHHTLRTIHSFHCPLYNMLSPMLCILWSLHNTPHTTHSTHCTNLHSTLCTLCPTSCTMPYTWSAIPKCTLYVHPIPNVYRIILHVKCLMYRIWFRVHSMWGQVLKVSCKVLCVAPGEHDRTNAPYTSHQTCRP